ncbi:hypothetical protein PF005_g31639 [Phytophthora fragariae]|uniref:Uncharacterized protein n=1 Tax=Phytophthora fragariae TaxID=53985 RepID=A0A6A3VI97_9STRA|nr:hypothetical protein PF003_g866 [Phytophthora fragariae]KAE8924312.1 hypothetical protein PF009_g25454 [Phytophthora fragariae]KAE8956469.1 hypothetical protein PF011_g31464 [Phytophthora fragariae]KAE9057872.1 hypothetical protein PF010_g31208 [Phytophthora fragariae]KAE9059721.1 hypothetical protein PF006_g31813 [Phytophthora fragariae]
MATFVLNLSIIRFVYARAIGRRLGSVDSTNRVRKLRLELTILYAILKGRSMETRAERRLG